FAELQRRSTTATGTAAGLSPYPHLSLAYGSAVPDMPDMAALQAGLSAAWAGRVLRTDRLAVCRSSKDISIADWQCVMTLALTGPEAPGPHQGAPVFGN
ncbi:MAG: hypothetical protein JWQ88_640, partial [Rhodoferax sp.]|nr:hypothetical protein [Rhodoferax sp.]